MSWVAPRTWVAGEVVTASLLNVHLRDQLLYLGGPDARSATPPTLPIDGQLWRYPADASAGVEWLLTYTASEPTNKWRALGPQSLVASAVIGAVSPGVAYVDLSTPISITVGRAGDYVHEWFGFGLVGSGGAIWHLALKKGAAATSDAESINTPGQANNVSASRLLVLAVAAGDVQKLQHKITTGSITFQAGLKIKPRRIT